MARDKTDTDLAAVTAAGVPGVTAVIRDGWQHQSRGVWARRGAHRPTHETGDRFRIGSLSETYVAVVLVQLADETKLSLEDSVERWPLEWSPTVAPSP